MNDIVTLNVDGESVSAPAGSILGHALHSLRGPALRETPRRGEPRGLFCVMGTCFDCLVTVDGASHVRACMVTIRNGMVVETTQR